MQLGWKRYTPRLPGRHQVASWAGALILGCLPLTAAAASCWPLWDRFSQQFIQSDGRVIDHSVKQMHSTSEGQSYAMFFALVANDQTQFDHLWRWSINNLFEGQIDQRLPAWQWGQKENGEWGIIDPNSASDADLWYAYSLLEAAVRWKQPDYRSAALTLLNQIIQQEVVELPGFGTMLLPGAQGFADLEQQRWRLNPSYLPMQLLHGLAHHHPEGPWRTIADNTLKLFEASLPQDLAPDWIAYEWNGQQGKFVTDPEKGAVGSYDAIRNYSWAGMLPHKQGRPLLNALSGMAKLTKAHPEQLPPESVNTETGHAQGVAPVGFSAALLPYFSQRRERSLYTVQQKRVAAAFAADSDAKPTYYDYVLTLFGTGWDEKRYRFNLNGSLLLHPEKTC